MRRLLIFVMANAENKNANIADIVIAVIVIFLDVVRDIDL